MEGEYPRFKSSYLQEELAEAFQLGPDEFDFVFRYRSDHNRHGIAIWLKSLLNLGYFPETLVLLGHKSTMRFATRSAGIS